MQLAVRKHLRRHVRGGAAGLGDEVALHRVLGAPEAQVADLGAAVRAQQDILGLEVAVHGGCVQEGQPLGNVEPDSHHVQVRQRLAAVVDAVVQRAAGHVLVDDAHLRRRQAGAVHPHDAVASLVGELRHDLDLVPEADHLRVAVHVHTPGKHLNRHVLPAPARLIDRSERPRAELGAQLPLQVAVPVDAQVEELAGRRLALPRHRRGQPLLEGEAAAHRAPLLERGRRLGVASPHGALHVRHGVQAGRISSERRPRVERRHLLMGGVAAHVERKASHGRKRHDDGAHSRPDDERDRAGLGLAARGPPRVIEVVARQVVVCRLQALLRGDVHHLQAAAKQPRELVLARRQPVLPALQFVVRGAGREAQQQLHGQRAPRLQPAARLLDAPRRHRHPRQPRQLYHVLTEQLHRLARCWRQRHQIRPVQLLQAAAPGRRGSGARAHGLRGDDGDSQLQPGAGAHILRLEVRHVTHGDASPNQPWIHAIGERPQQGRRDARVLLRLAQG
mmetsp:Transcript_10114/g.26096  ORF Transcript_10114/g.26096 Transcript_10114/m.26096 type:complete len:505 (-) Transcript_10114:772-2286(-)